MPDREPSALWKQQVELRVAEAGHRVRTLSRTVQTLSDDLRKDSGGALFADYVERGADAIDRVGVYFEETDFDTLLADAEAYSRDHLTVVGVAGVALGIAASRVVKATAARRAVAVPPAAKAEPAQPKRVSPRRPRVKKTADAS